MHREQILELIQLSDKSLVEILNDVEVLYTSGIEDDEALYITLRDYYINGRREENK